MSRLDSKLMIENKKAIHVGYEVIKKATNHFIEHNSRCYGESISHVDIKTILDPYSTLDNRDVKDSLKTRSLSIKNSTASQRQSSYPMQLRIPRPFTHISQEKRRQTLLP